MEKRQRPIDRFKRFHSSPSLRKKDGQGGTSEGYPQTCHSESKTSIDNNFQNEVKQHANAKANEHRGKSSAHKSLSYRSGDRDEAWVVSTCSFVSDHV